MSNLSSNEGLFLPSHLLRPYGYSSSNILSIKQVRRVGGRACSKTTAA